MNEKKPIDMIGKLDLSRMFNGCISKKVVGYIPFNWSKLAAKFLQFPNHCSLVFATGKRVNQRAGFGLEIPIDYIFTETLK